MTLAERIVAAKKLLLEKKDHLVSLTVKMQETPDDDSLITQVDTVSAEIELDQKNIDSLERAEKALAARSAPVIIEAKHLGSHDDAKNFIFREAALKFTAQMQNKSIEQVLHERYARDEVFNDYIRAKATQNPAQTNVAGYVQDLINPVAVAGWLEYLTPASVVARLPFRRMEFNQSNWAGAKFLYRNPAKKAAAAYRREGAPSVVKGALFSSVTIPPYIMTVITTATLEALKNTPYGLEGILRQAMIQDTAEALDVSVISNAAAVAGLSPAGLLNGVTPIVSSGQDLDQIQNDVRAMKTVFINANMGTGLYWVMSDATVLYLQTVTNALGAYVYKDELAKGMWEGLPYVSSTSVSSDEIILFATPEIAYAQSAPEISMSLEATLHEEDSAPAEVGGSTSPVRSLFQTNSWAIKNNFTQSHLKLRTPAVQVLDISSWT
jgi:HK97 family phage major capsid protein